MKLTFHHPGQAQVSAHSLPQLPGPQNWRKACQDTMAWILDKPGIQAILLGKLGLILVVRDFLHVVDNAFVVVQVIVLCEVVVLFVVTWALVEPPHRL